MNFLQRIPFETLMEPVCAILLGEPNARLSRPPRNVRYGSNGSLSVNFETGEFYDHEAKRGGGVLDLIQHKLGCDHGGAVAWLRGQGLMQPGAMRPVVTPSEKEDNKPKRVVCAYQYVDENDILLHQTIRFEPKTFRQRRPDPDNPGEWIWNLNEIRTVIYRLPEVLNAMSNGDTIYVTEGEKDADALRSLGFTATTNPMGAGNWRTEYSELLRGGDVVAISDNDKTGRNHAEQIASSLNDSAARIRILDIRSVWPECPEKGDVSDWIAAGGTADKLNEIVAVLRNWEPATKGTATVAGDKEWPEPKPLPNGLAPVEEFSGDFLPAALAPWVDDIADRLQCPPDYVAVAAVTALGSVIGRRIGIKPQMKTDWIEIPNIWGAFIGRPGMLKSPAMGEALKPIHYLEAEAVKNNNAALKAYTAELEAFKLRRKNNSPNSDLELGDAPEKPALIRYRTNDSSYESLGELLIDNPTGMLVERDELISLLNHLDREEQGVARGFYLSGWSGSQPYTFDRIGRGHRHIEAVCISVLGNTQPAKAAEYVRRANLDDAGGDGLIQRFGLIVWPDASPEWKDVDEYANSEARENAWNVYERASELDEPAAFALGASRGKYDRIPTLRFDGAAHADFLEWRTDLERRLRSGELPAALEGHLAKYRKLVPALALINHIADAGDGPVTQESLVRALAFAHYLESHARRVYGSTSQSELAAGKAILKHIRNGDLQDGFTARDIHQRGWGHLTERGHVGAGLALLIDLGYLAELIPVSKPQGGRPRIAYAINPRGLK
jgi:Protein of unknown function (DUF3987)